MNKKGMTLVEIIISIVLISIVLIFLFSLLITVKDINSSSEVNSTYLINKSLLLKNIEEDFSKAKTVSLSNCEPVASGRESVTALYSGYNNSEEYFKDKDDNDLGDEYKVYNCIKFNYNAGASDESSAYLGIYYYKNKEKYVISYIHDAKNIKATRELPDYEKKTKNILTATDSGVINTWTYNNGDLPSTSTNLTDGKFHIINIPIIGSDGKDYGINISYYKNAT